MSLGWQQKKILQRLTLLPGQNTTQLLKGLTRSNQPEKRLERRGFIENQGDKRVNSWFITPLGEETLKKVKRH